MDGRKYDGVMGVPVTFLDKYPPEQKEVEPMSEKIKTKLAGLKLRAAKVKANQTLRHCPNQHDVVTSRDNAMLLQMCQYQAIREENLK